MHFIDNNHALFDFYQAEIFLAYPSLKPHILFYSDGIAI